jgi:hypothetical protein
MAAEDRLRAVTERYWHRIRVHGPRVLAGLWIAAVIVVSVQATAHHSNNFEIFRTSWLNLVAGRDLYAPSARHRDFFLYSPTFALLFAPFAVVPFWLGVIVWNGVNAGALYWGLGRVLSPDQAFAARTIVFLDTVGSLQNVQSNALVAGLMIICFAELERRHEFRAALAVAAGTAIKIFPIVAAVFAVFRPWRLPRFALFCLLGALLLVAAPLLVTSPAALLNQYRSWMAIGSAVAIQRNYSVMEQLHIWLGVDWPNWPVQLIGVIVLLSPLVRLPSWGNLRFRLRFLASVLMFCVLFNHKAESPSFVIAVAGVAIWFVVTECDRLAWAVLAIVVVGTVLAASDAMPEVLQQRFFQPYRIKTLPILLVWTLTQAQLWRRSESAPRQDSSRDRAAPAT